MRLVDRRPAATERANFTSDYDDATLRAIIRLASEVAVDPKTAIAIWIAESTGGKYRNDPRDQFSAWQGSEFNLGNEYADPYENDVLGVIYSDTKNMEKIFPWLDTYEHRRITTDPFKMAIIKAYFNLLRAENKRVDQLEEINNIIMRNQIPKEDILRPQIQTIADKLRYAEKVFGRNIPEEKKIQAYQGYGKYRNAQGQVVDARKTLPYGRRIVAIKKYMLNNPILDAVIEAVTRKKH